MRLISVSILCLLSAQIFCILHRRTNDIFKEGHHTFIESHRGVNREIFQNTMKAFNRAVQYDVDAIETDVWLCKDKIPVIVHGGAVGNLDGYYKDGGIVTELTWEELSKKRTVEDDLPMPRLDELFDYAHNNLFINLEIKDGRVDEVFPVVSKMMEEKDMMDQMELSSFIHSYIDVIEEYNKNHEKKIVFGFIFNGGTKIDDLKFDYPGHSLNLYWKDVTKEICDKAHKNGMGVMAWFGMGDRETTDIYRGLIEKGADVICSNESLLAKKFRDAYYGDLMRKK